MPLDQATRERQMAAAAAAARAEEPAAPTVHRVSDTAYISTARDPDGNELHRIMTERRAPRYQRAVPTQPAATPADSATATAAESAGMAAAQWMAVAAEHDARVAEASATPPPPPVASPGVGMTPVVTAALRRLLQHREAEAAAAARARQGQEILRGTRVLTAEERLEHAAHGREMLERLDALQARTAAVAARAEEAAAPTVREAAEMESDDDGDEWEDGGDADEILAQARRAEAAAHRAARQGLLERSIPTVRLLYGANDPRDDAVDSNGAPPPSFFSRHVWRSLWRDVTRLQHPPYLPTPPAAMPPPEPPPAKPTRKEDLHFLRDLIESVQEARPDVVSEGAYLRSSNLLRDLFREEDAKEVRYEQRTGRPLPQNILAPPDEVNEVE